MRGLWIERRGSGQGFIFVVRRPDGNYLNKQGGFEIGVSDPQHVETFEARCSWPEFGAALTALDHAMMAHD